MVTIFGDLATPGGVEFSDSNFFSHSSYNSWKKGFSSGLGLTAMTCLSLTQISWKRHLASLFLCSGVVCCLLRRLYVSFLHAFFLCNANRRLCQLRSTQFSLEESAYGLTFYSFVSCFALPQITPALSYNKAPCPL